MLNWDSKELKFELIFKKKMNKNESCNASSRILNLNWNVENHKKDEMISNDDFKKCELSTLSGIKGEKGNKNLSIERKVSIPHDKHEEKSIELLGSVTTHSCPGTRTSARVIQKMKLDLTRPTTPPPAASERESKKEEKHIQKTPSQLRSYKTSWSNLERNYFFDSLNEFGKDFEAIGNYINAKLKRKSSTDISYKTKDQIRQHYYQTYHKICKYVRISDEIKKPVQELYILINYGEMRRKLQFVTDKHFMKLKHLVYKGHITIRCKGKNIRLKTPSCRALRKLNQLDDSLEDIRLPSKIDVIINPANMESFGRVQSMAQNPRVRTTVPLQKKLINFIKTFETKWQATPSRYSSILQHPNDQIDKLMQTNENFLPQYYQEENEICFLPKPNVTIHRPLLSITEYLSSVNLCLTAYEDRMRIQVRSESLCSDRFNSGKRQRTESGSEKRSPDIKKQKLILKDEEKSADDYNDIHLGKDDYQNLIDDRLKSVESSSSQEMENFGKSESSSDELNEDHQFFAETSSILETKQKISVREIQQHDKLETNLTICGQFNPQQQINQNSIPQNQRSKRPTPLKPIRSSVNYQPLLDNNCLKRIRNGWTISNAADITIGDLYVVLGQDSRLELDYYWKKVVSTRSVFNENNLHIDLENNHNTKQSHQTRLPYNTTHCDDSVIVDKISHSSIGNKLKHLLLIANLSERIRKRHCFCGHVCEKNNTKTKIDRESSLKSSIYNRNIPSSTTVSTNNESILFRQPYPATRRQIFCQDTAKQLSALSRQKMSRQVLIQRLLLPGSANGSKSLDILNSKLMTQSGLEKNSINEKSVSKNINNDSFSSMNSYLQNQPKQSESKLGETIDNSAIANATDFKVSSETIQTTNEKVEDHKINETLIQNSIENEYFDKNTLNSDINEMKPISLSSMNVEIAFPSKCGDASPCLQTPNHLLTSSFDEGSCTTNSIFNGLFSPMQLFRDSASNSRWFEENFNDFSLNSLLGHLDDLNPNREHLNVSSNISVISESSVDFRQKFQEISALMQNEDKDKSLEE